MLVELPRKTRVPELDRRPVLTTLSPLIVTVKVQLQFNFWQQHIFQLLTCDFILTWCLYTVEFQCFIPTHCHLLVTYLCTSCHFKLVVLYWFAISYLNVLILIKLAHNPVNISCSKLQNVCCWQSKSLKPVQSGHFLQQAVRLSLGRHLISGSFWKLFLFCFVLHLAFFFCSPQIDVTD